MCRSTVRTLSTSASAISWLVCPAATSLTTSTSRGVNAGPSPPDSGCQGGREDEASGALLADETGGAATDLACRPAETQVGARLGHELPVAFEQAAPCADTR